jgi:hypothetical protein
MLCPIQPFGLQPLRGLLVIWKKLSWWKVNVFWMSWLTSDECYLLKYFCGFTIIASTLPFTFCFSRLSSSTHLRAAAESAISLASFSMH